MTIQVTMMPSESESADVDVSFLQVLFPRYPLLLRRSPKLAGQAHRFVAT